MPAKNANRPMIQRWRLVFNSRGVVVAGGYVRADIGLRLVEMTGERVDAPTDRGMNAPANDPNRLFPRLLADMVWSRSGSPLPVGRG